MKCNECGRTMIEMVGVIGIMGLLSVGGLAGFSKIIANNKINEAIEQVSVISSKLSTIASRGIDYDGLDNYTAVKLGAVPANAVADANKCNQTSCNLTNPFGGSIDIEASTLELGGGEESTSDNLAYTITYTALDTVSCVRMATSNYGSNENSTIIGIGVAGSADTATKVMTNYIYKGCPGGNDKTNYVAACTGGATVSVPLTVAQAQTVCSSCGKQSKCVFTIKYF